MNKLVLRSSLASRMLHWIGALGFLFSAVLIYIFVFLIPYQGATMNGCPSVCEYPTDCRVAECGSPRVSASCDPETKKCVMGGGHSSFFSASSILSLLLIGLGWLGVAFYKNSLTLEASEDGIRFSRMATQDMNITWDTFLGITFHGVTNRLGQPLTVYSITGDAGILSFIVKGLPPNTSTREIEMGGFLFLNISPEENEKLLALIKEHTDQEPEPEREW